MYLLLVKKIESENYVFSVFLNYFCINKIYANEHYQQFRMEICHQKI